jgi:hypothetical protein
MDEKMDSARERIRALLAERPMTISALVQEVGISRQRVHQIVTQEGLKVSKYSNPLKRRPAAPPPQPRIKVGVSVGQVNHTVAGTIAEMLAAADLMARGWNVFFPLVRTTRCDLIAVSADGQRVRRIEVRSGRRSNGSVRYLKKEQASCDHYAVVIPDEPIAYDPPIELGG